MTTVAILNPRCSQGDTAGTDALGMYGVLKEQGHEVRLFANTSDLPEPPLCPLSELPGFLGGDDGLLIYHHAAAWDRGPALLRDLRCKKVVKYHDVPQEEYFEREQATQSGDYRVARDQLRATVQAGDFFLADTPFIRGELIAEGAAQAETRVVGPFHATDRHYSLEADLETLKSCRDGKTNLLTVGPLWPHKRHDVLLAAFAAYHHGYNRNSRLVVVGGEVESCRDYPRRLRGLAAGLDVEEAVVFAGAVADPVLKGYYLAADVFLLTSEYEGFCLPLLEAMALKVPVVAVDATAVGDLVGEAGLVWEAPEVDLLAESIHAVVSDRGTGTALGFQGWGRYRRFFSNERMGAAFLQALGGLL